MDRQVFSIINDGEYFEYKGNRYIRIGMTVYNMDTKKYLIFGIDF